MIDDYVKAVANQLGIRLSRIEMIDGQAVSCLDAHLLHLSAEGHTVSAIVHSQELDVVLAGKFCEPLELRLLSVLYQLKTNIDELPESGD